MVKKSPLEMKTYKQLYYIYNRDKLIEYSQQYYKYNKSNRNFENETDYDEKMKTFLKYYKPANPQNKLNLETEPIKISKDNTIVIFD
jgi:hypothetical protein